MSTITMPRLGGFETSSAIGLASPSALFMSVKRFYRIRAARHALGSMPDYLLHDIGISRSEIDTVTRNGRR
jgi:uncharacterized protein YjiS (DUF1127 family)